MKASVVAILFILAGASAEKCQTAETCNVEDEASLVQKVVHVHEDKAEIPTAPPSTAVRATLDVMLNAAHDEKANAANALKDGDEAFNFSPDNGMSCLQGKKGYLETIQYRLTNPTSPLAKMYAEASVKKGTCESMGFDDGPYDEKCFPRSTQFRHKVANTTESDAWETDLQFAEGKAIRAYMEARGATAKEAIGEASNGCLLEGDFGKDRDQLTHGLTALWNDKVSNTDPDHPDEIVVKQKSDYEAYFIPEDTYSTRAGPQGSFLRPETRGMADMMG